MNPSARGMVCPELSRLALCRWCIEVVRFDLEPHEVLLQAVNLFQNISSLVVILAFPHRPYRVNQPFCICVGMIWHGHIKVMKPLVPEVG